MRRANLFDRLPKTNEAVRCAMRGIAVTHRADISRQAAGARNSNRDTQLARFAATSL